MYTYKLYPNMVIMLDINFLVLRSKQNIILFKKHKEEDSYCIIKRGKRAFPLGYKDL